MFDTGGRGTHFTDRSHAGEVLAAAVTGYAGRDDVIVLGLVRGGVPVAAPVAAALKAPLDVLVVRKLGVPWAPEVAFGALGPGGVRVRNDDVESRLPPRDVAAVVEQETAELTRRERRYRGDRPPLDLAGRVAIIVDDGLATGATARAAVEVARRLGAVTVVVAVPVAAPDSLLLVRAAADEVVCPAAPARFMAVSQFYDEFPQTTDTEVLALLATG
ncbi:phosphoribosyltransferase [Luedemannella flava]|uniref:Phosphoribosyltransferase n=1 Tax=Luedemannella flava TaxID=349316 RepID=A0ABN2MF68_9ACTN